MNVNIFETNKQTNNAPLFQFNQLMHQKAQQEKSSVSSPYSFVMTHVIALTLLTAVALTAVSGGY